MNGLHVEYIYHQHTGDSTNGGGCYSLENYVSSEQLNITVTSYENMFHTDGTWRMHFYGTCPKCGKVQLYVAYLGTTAYDEPNKIVGNTYVHEHDVIKQKYVLSCNKTEKTIEQAIISF